MTIKIKLGKEIIYAPSSGFSHSAATLATNGKFFREPADLRRMQSRG